MRNWRSPGKSAGALIVFFLSTEEISSIDAWRAGHVSRIPIHGAPLICLPAPPSALRPKLLPHRLLPLPTQFLGRCDPARPSLRIQLTHPAYASSQLSCVVLCSACPWWFVHP